MKKIITTLFIVLGFYGISLAQDKGQTEFGVNIGLNGAYVIEGGNSDLHTDSKTGFNAGVSADTYFSRSWSLKVKLIYDQKGWANGYLVDAGGNESDNINYNLNYLTIPVMASWHFGRTSNWYLNFGPYVGILTGATAAGTDVKSFFNTTDVGIDLGIGVKIPVNQTTKFFIEYDGQGGFTNIAKVSSDGSTLQNIRESINIGLSFSMN